METPSVVKAPDGTYRLYYSANLPPKGSNRFAIGLAISDDGKTWKKYGAGPIFAPESEWEKPFGENLKKRIGGTLEPSVLYDGTAKVFKMWYAALGTKMDSFPTYRIGYATSPDGIRWKRASNPVFEPGATGAWDEACVSHTHVLADSRHGCHLYYFGSSLKDQEDTDKRGACAFTRGAIGHAYSKDGIAWQRDLRPALSSVPGTWEAWTLHGPSALVRGDKLYVWYFGSEKHDSPLSHIGLALGDWK